LEKWWRNTLHCAAENATLDFVWGCVLKCITQNWITGSKGDNWISQAVPQKPYMWTMCKW
jgi:hypothetical protein